MYKRCNPKVPEIGDIVSNFPKIDPEKLFLLGKYPPSL